MTPNELVVKYLPLARKIGTKHGLKDPERIRDDGDGRPLDAVQDACVALVEASRQPHGNPAKYLRMRIEGALVDAARKAAKTDVLAKVKWVPCPVCDTGAADPLCGKCLGTGRLNHWTRVDALAADRAADAAGEAEQWSDLDAAGGLEAANATSEASSPRLQDELRADANALEKLLADANRAEWRAHRATLRRAIGRLGDLERRVIRGCMAGKTQDDIAADMGISAATVSRISATAMEVLRNPPTGAGKDERARWDAMAEDSHNRWRWTPRKVTERFEGCKYAGAGRPFMQTWQPYTVWKDLGRKNICVVESAA